MNDDREKKEELKAVLAAGVAIQSISAIVAYALQSGKTEFLKELNVLLLRFQQSLTEEEKQELKIAIEKAVNERAAEFLLTLGAKLSEDELTEALKMLKDIGVPPQQPSS